MAHVEIAPQVGKLHGALSYLRRALQMEAPGGGLQDL